MPAYTLQRHGTVEKVRTLKYWVFVRKDLMKGNILQNVAASKIKCPKLKISDLIFYGFGFKKLNRNLQTEILSRTVCFKSNKRFFSVVHEGFLGELVFLFVTRGIHFSSEAFRVIFQAAALGTGGGGGAAACLGEALYPIVKAWSAISPTGGLVSTRSDPSSGIPTPCRFLKPPKSAPKLAPKSAPNSELPKPTERMWEKRDS